MQPICWSWTYIQNRQLPISSLESNETAERIYCICAYYTECRYYIDWVHRYCNCVTGFFFLFRNYRGNTPSDFSSREETLMTVLEMTLGEYKVN